MLDQFTDMDLGPGWWFYFQLRLAGSDEDFKNDFIEEIERLFEIERSEQSIGQNDQVKEGIPMRRVWRKVY